jgi:selenide,water dikinase
MKRLVLVGGGHAHLGVLRALAARPIPGWQVQLVSPEPQQIYSGMLPGWIAGHYALPEILLPVAALAANAGVAFHETRGVALDLAGHALHCGNGERIAFDAVSLDVGSVGAIEAAPEADAACVPVRPLSRLAASWLAAQAQIGGQCSPFHVVIVGAGAAGVELALAVRHRGMREGWSHLRVTLVGSDALPLDGAPLRARRTVHKLLAQRCIGWLGARRAACVRPGQIDFDDGGELPFDLCWTAAGAAAPHWLASSGLDLDADGFVRVNASLQSLSHPQVFAAGDVAAHPQPLPRSGVHAVRAGAPLARSLRAYCAGQALPRWTPRVRALNLLSTADQRALALWGSWSWRSAWAWRWKDAIDRRFVGGAGR